MLLELVSCAMMFKLVAIAEYSKIMNIKSAQCMSRHALGRVPANIRIYGSGVQGHNAGKFDHETDSALRWSGAWVGVGMLRDAGDFLLGFLFF